MRGSEKQQDSLFSYVPLEKRIPKSHPLRPIRSERLLIEQLDYNLLFRWFVGLKMDDPVWNHSVFSKNRDRLLNTEIAGLFFASIRDQAAKKKLISDEHFSDGTLLEAWASMKSFQPKGSDKNDPPDTGSGKNPTVNFRGQKRKNAMHQSVSRSRGQALQKSQGSAGQAMLPGPCTDGKPQRAGS
jgi:hypothetical protein